MAQSPSHKFGQIIGDLLESALFAPLKSVADKHGLYLDYKHRRPARRNRKKVAWTDHKSNIHDLDYVLEINGSETQIGTPKAFIESAWRRYTKHSRNKSQEIQGAITPLATTYSEHSPFLGVVLGGVFTDGSLQQLRSHGFSILYYPYEAVVDAFASAGINAAFDEDTSDADLQGKVEDFEALDSDQKRTIITTLRELRKTALQSFLEELEASLNRKVSRVYIVTLHGSSGDVGTVEEAISFIAAYDEAQTVAGFAKYELNVRYSNGDRITGDFSDKKSAIAFLRKLT